MDKRIYRRWIAGFMLILMTLVSATVMVCAETTKIRQVRRNHASW